MLLAGLLAGGGALLAWLTLSAGGTSETLSLKGTESGGEGVWIGDIAPGWWAIIGGGLLVVVGIVLLTSRDRGQRRTAGVAGCAFAVVTAGVAFFEFSHAHAKFNEYLVLNSLSDSPLNTVHLNMGNGLLVTFAGCVLGLVASIVAISQNA